MSLLNLFNSVFNTTSTISAISPADFLLCVGVSLVIGLFLTLAYTYHSRHSKGFVITLAMIPAVVCVVIMMVNGNIGAGVAVAGAFSLVRFRSVPGTAKEIGAIFLAMGAGLATGMGYLGYAVLFSLILSAVSMIYTKSSLGSVNQNERNMRITIPENLDYTHIFDDLFEKYTKNCDITDVKTTDMGSLFKLTYRFTLHRADDEKQFIDELRCRNGNLEINIARALSSSTEL